MGARPGRVTEGLMDGANLLQSRRLRGAVAELLIELEAALVVRQGRIERSELEPRDRDRHVHGCDVVAVAGFLGEREGGARVAFGLRQLARRPQGGGSRAESPREERW